MPNFITIKDLISSFDEPYISANEEGSFLDKIGIDQFDIRSGDDSIEISLTLLIDEEIGFSIPGADGLGIFLALKEVGVTAISLEVLFSDEEVSLQFPSLDITFRFPPTMLKPAVQQVDGSFEVAESTSLYEITTRGIGLGYSTLGNFNFSLDSAPLSLKINPVMIGDTGFVFEADGVQLFLGANTSAPEGHPDGFKGLYINGATLHLPKDFALREVDISLEHAGVGNGGVFGTLSLEWNDNTLTENPADGETFVTGPATGTFLDAPFALKEIALTLDQNIPTEVSLKAELLLPFFNKAVGIEISIETDGNFSFTLRAIESSSNDNLIQLDIPQLLQISVESFTGEKKDDLGIFSIKGQLKPLLGGFDWPSFDIDQLSIDTNGDVEFDGGWVDLPESFTLNFNAFKISISQFGFGTEGEESESIRQWLGLSGELNLVEGLDIKASVDGLKFSWLKDPVDGDRDVKTTLKGIAVEFEIPNTLSFSGSVQYEELTPDNNGGTGLTGKLFRGNIDLNLMSIRLQLEAELIIGKMKDADGNEFTSFFIVMGAQLPAGIPLGATGTSLYGIKGLAAINAAPTKTEEQNWYEWYMAEPEREITSMQKWMPKHDNYAFGAGVTIGTLFDDGFTLNMSVMLVVLLPGPVIILEGKANLLKQRTGEQQEAGGPEGAFYLLAVLDGRAGTFMLNVDVKYSLEDVITIGASLEAFFDFNNSSNWYLYIGRKEPEKRIRAEILSLFQANAYFMIDNTSLQTGASVGFDFRKKYGPVSVVLIAKIGFDATIFWKPMQLQGGLELEASLGIKVFGIGLELYLYMLLEGRVPQPYWVHGIAEVGISLFWPLPDLSLRVELEWSQPAPTLPAWPLLKSCTFTHHKGSGSTWALMISDDTSMPPWAEFPIVPVDSRPILSFARPLNNLGQRENSSGLVVPIFKTPFDKVGDQQFTYKLDRETMALEVFDGTEWISSKTGINTSVDDNEDNCFIIERDSIINIQDDLDPEEPQIQLWKYSARDHVQDYGREDYNQNHPACNPRLRQKYFTINWLGVPHNTQYNSAFHYANISFIASQNQGNSLPFVLDYFLNTRDITLNFPEPIIQVAIRLQKTKFSINIEDEMNQIQAFVGMNGNEVGSMTKQGTTLIYTGVDQFNSVSIKGVAISIRDIKYMTLESAVDQLIGTDNPSPSAARQKINGSLFLEPAKFYRLKVKTSVDINETRDKYSAENYIYFRTDEGPGISEVSENPMSSGGTQSLPKRNLTHKEKPVNLLATYIERTLPIDGALNHYLDYDVGVQFNEAYVEDLFSEEEGIRMRFRDRNGKLLDEPTGDFRLGFLPLFHPGLLSWLQDKEQGACGSNGASTTPSPYLNFSLGLPFKGHSLYKAEMVINTDLGEQSLHDFQFTTSRYSNFTNHILGSYSDDILPIIKLPIASSLPLLFNIGRLNTLAREYKDLVSTFNTEDRTNLLEKKRLYDQSIQLRVNIEKISAHKFTQLDEKVSESLASIDMTNRPSPEKFEAFQVPLKSGKSLILFESPEPIDWYRISATAKRLSGSSMEIGFVWNEDKTRAFLYNESVPFFENVDYNFELNFSGTPDPSSGVILRNNLIVEEDVSFEVHLGTYPQ